MSMPHQCSKCMTIFTPLRRGNYAFCPCCVVALRNDSADAERYQRRIAAGDINVCPENDADHRTVRRLIKRRHTTEPDTKMPTWRDKK